MLCHVDWEIATNVSGGEYVSIFRVEQLWPACVMSLGCRLKEDRWWNKRYEIGHGTLRSDATEAKAAASRERRRNAVVGNASWC
jgi:hypothetical protein